VECRGKVPGQGFCGSFLPEAGDNLEINVSFYYFEKQNMFFAFIFGTANICFITKCV